MRSAPIRLVVLGLALAACKGEPFRPDAKLDGPVPDDAYEVPWWTPEPGETLNWDVQLAPMFDTAPPRAMYDLDLWDVTPATTIDYGDGNPVVVPAGALAGVITELHQRTPRPIVVCHVNTGAIELDDPDAMKFPGYQANPPNRPTPPAAGSVIGWDTSRQTEPPDPPEPPKPNERYLDGRAAARAIWAPIMWKRFDLAKQIGCDAIEPDHVDSVLNDPGFPLIARPDDQTSFFVDVAAQAHQRELSVGMKNGHVVPGQPDQLAPHFDWMMIESCGRFMDCDTARPFLDMRKAVFAIDDAITIDAACMEYGSNMIREGLIKDAARTSVVRETCP